MMSFYTTFANNATEKYSPPSSRKGHKSQSSFRSSRLQRNDESSFRHTTKKSKSKQRRHVHFAEEDQVQLITPLFGHDLWFQDTRSQIQAETRKILHTDQSATQYSMAYDMAYSQFRRCLSVSDELKEHVVSGVKQGHRTIEGRSIAALQQHHLQQNAVRSILKKQHALRALKVRNADKELRQHSVDLSVGSRHWAAFMGDVDAAAVVEADFAPAQQKTHSIHALVPPARSALAPTSNPDQQFEQVVRKEKPFPLWRAIKHFTKSLAIEKRGKNANETASTTTEAWFRFWRQSYVSVNTESKL